SAYGLNYGNLSRDIRHNFQASWIAEVPFGKGRRWIRGGPAAQIVGGWQISGLLSAYTGQPFTATASNTTLNSQASSQRADCIAAPPQKTGDILQWYGKSGFAVPTAFRFGTCGYNSLTGPGVVNLDLGIDHKWQLGERFDLKFRAESFNAGNTPHHANPNSTQASVNNSSFMQVT